MQTETPREPLRRRATYTDVLDAPEDKIAELLEGELVLSPRPNRAHAVVSSSLGIEIGSPFQRGRGGPGGWVFLDEPELHLGLDVLVPDLAGWRRERMEPTGEGAFFTVVPDWVCEVLSPSTAARDRTVKMRIYAREKVGRLWLIDPVERYLEAFSLTDGAWVRAAAVMASEVARVPPFDAIELDLSVLWTP